MIRLTQNKVMALHRLLAEETGGETGLRDESLLNSALNAPFQTFDGKELYETIEEKGARLGYSLIKNHAFLDGNKRIGILVLMVFLEVNGVPLRPTPEELTRVTLDVASGELGYEELLAWVVEKKGR